MMPRNNSRRSVGLYAIIAGSLLSTATAAGQVDQIGTKYEALHTGLAQLFPEPWRTLCLKDTDFTSPGAFAITSACKASNENELSDCTPECVKWFEDFGPECKLLEDAAKLQVVRAVNKGKPTSDETKALMAWYVLSSTVVCPHAPTLSLSRSLAFSLSQVRFLHGEELQRWVLTSNATAAVRRDTHSLSLTRAARIALQKQRVPPRATLSSISRSTKRKKRRSTRSSWRRWRRRRTRRRRRSRPVGIDFDRRALAPRAP